MVTFHWTNTPQHTSFRIVFGYPVYQKHDKNLQTGSKNIQKGFKYFYKAWKSIDNTKSKCSMLIIGQLKKSATKICPEINKQNLLIFETTNHCIHDRHRSQKKTFQNMILYHTVQNQILQYSKICIFM